MKKILYLLLFICVYGYSAAQTRIIPGEIQGKNETYIVHKFKFNLPDPKFGHLLIYSKSNSYKYNWGFPYPKDSNVNYYNPKTDVHFDNDAVNRILYNILNAGHLDSLKHNKEQIGFIFVFEQNGDLAKIAFGLNEHTLITLEKIEDLDKQLRANIKATFTGTAYSQFPAIYYDTPNIMF